MKPHLWMTGLLLLGLPAQAQTTQPITAAKNQMAAVPPEVLLIEEDSLPLDPSLQSSTRPAESSTAGARSSAAYVEDSRSKDNGLKLYRFMVAPGETLTTKVESDAAEVVTQRFGLLSGPSFTPSAVSKGEINRINRLSRQQRTTKIEFKNFEGRPFPLLLIVYGSVGHPYKIHIARTPSK